MKLISMKQMLHEIDDYVRESQNFRRGIDLLIEHSDLIETPLKLGQFIPCDKEGNVLEKPQKYDLFKSVDRLFHIETIQICKQYQEALDSVIFEGFEIEEMKDYYIIQKDGINIWLSWNKSKTIEDLVDLNLTIKKL